MMMLMLMQCSWLTCKLTLGVLHPVPRAKQHLHPRASSHKDTPSWDLSRKPVPATVTYRGKCLGTTLRHDKPQDSSQNLARSTQASQYTQDICQDLPKSVIRFHGTTCLNRFQPLPTNHDIIDIMGSSTMLGMLNITTKSRQFSNSDNGVQNAKPIPHTT